MGRYESGQAHCQICDIWIDHKGAHVKGDLPATEELTGWFCNCCNYRVRRKPRNKKYKEALRAKRDPARKGTDKIKSRIPKDHELTRVILRICKDGKPYTTRVMLDEIADEFGLGEQERSFAGSGKETLLSNRQRWAIYYLKKANLVTQSRGSITITDSGRIMLKRNPPKMDRKFLLKIAEDGSFGTDSVGESDQVSKDRNKMNKLITSVLNSIKRNAEGIYLSDLKRELGISDIDKVKLLPKLARIDGVIKKEILHKGTHLDTLLKYKSQNKSITKDIDVEPNIEKITKEMIMEHMANKRDIIKELRRHLTKEFVELRSMKKLMENNPGIPKDTIKRHARTSLRLPDKLRKMENEGTLHPDPECSLQIALFAVNHYDWDGEKEKIHDVVHMVQSILECLRDNNDLKLMFTGRKIVQHVMHKNDVSAAIAVWIATAMLHKEHGLHKIFSNQTIIEKVIQQKLCNVSDKTISDHVAGHCVANAPTTTSSTHRKLYRVSSGMYRLYKRGEPYHHTREHCKIAPLAFQLPDEYKELRSWYDKEYCNT